MVNIISSHLPRLAIGKGHLTAQLAMNAPIPANDTQPLRVGDRVRILPQFQDPGDDEYERVVIEAPADSPRVLVETRIPGLTYNPTERIDASMLERV